jgi:coenzyme PQQ biosynthesis protein PqqD
MTPASRPKRHIAAAWQAIDNEIVLLPPGNEKIIGLNASAGRVWSLADGTRTIADIAGELSQDYDASADSICPQVLAFVDTLVRRGWIEVDDG